MLLTSDNWSHGASVFLTVLHRPTVPPAVHILSHKGPDTDTEIQTINIHQLMQVVIKEFQ